VDQIKTEENPLIAAVIGPAKRGFLIGNRYVVLLVQVRGLGLCSLFALVLIFFVAINAKAIIAFFFVFRELHLTYFACFLC